VPGAGQQAARGLLAIGAEEVTATPRVASTGVGALITPAGTTNDGGQIIVGYRWFLLARPISGREPLMAACC
jgi:hypothetical protein